MGVKDLWLMVLKGIKQMPLLDFSDPKDRVVGVDISVLLYKLIQTNLDIALCLLCIRPYPPKLLIAKLSTIHESRISTVNHLYSI